MVDRGYPVPPPWRFLSCTILVDQTQPSFQSTTLARGRLRPGNVQRCSWTPRLSTKSGVRHARLQHDFRLSPMEHGVKSFLVFLSGEKQSRPDMTSGRLKRTPKKMGDVYLIIRSNVNPRHVFVNPRHIYLSVRIEVNHGHVIVNPRHVIIWNFEGLSLHDWNNKDGATVTRPTPTPKATQPRETSSTRRVARCGCVVAVRSAAETNGGVGRSIAQIGAPTLSPSGQRGSWIVVAGRWRVSVSPHGSWGLSQRESRKLWDVTHPSAATSPERTYSWASSPTTSTRTHDP